MIFFEGLVIEQQIFPRVHTTVITSIDSTRRTTGTIRTQRPVELVAVPRTDVNTDIRTVFNILGPLANPSRAKNMVVGVYSPSLTEKVATAMSRLGVERAYVVSGEDKAETVKNAFFGPVTPQVPASILQLHNDLTVVADEAAMSVIKANHR